MSAALQDGFTVLPAIFTQEEIASLRQAIADSIDRVARVMLTPFAASLPSAPIEERLERVAREDRAYASALLQVVMADAQRDPRVAAIATHPSLSESIVTLLAPDLPSGHVIRTRAAIPAFRSRISRGLSRPPGAPPCGSPAGFRCRTLTSTAARSKCFLAHGTPPAPMKLATMATSGSRRRRCRASNRASCPCDRAMCCSSTGSSPTARGRRVGCRDGGRW
jgi:hypothetical protein